MANQPYRNNRHANRRAKEHYDSAAATAILILSLACIAIIIGLAIGTALVNQ